MTYSNRILREQPACRIRQLIAVILCLGCPSLLVGENDAPPPIKQSPLKIQQVGKTPKGFSKVFSKQVVVFGLSVFATANVSDQDVMHAAGVLAQYLDNDEDGFADNPKVISALQKHRGCIVMFSNQAAAEQTDLHEHIPETVWDAMINVGLWGSETHPRGSTPGNFDATLEEVLHLVTSAGYSMAYPDVFGETAGTKIANAMDKARGGHFRRVPRNYPASAWYSYDDKSCDYRCQITEYFYWGLTSLLGAQDYPGRGQEIQHEWKLNTRAKLQDGDPQLYRLLTDPKYRFPKRLPDGRYRKDS